MSSPCVPACLLVDRLHTEPGPVRSHSPVLATQLCLRHDLLLSRLTIKYGLLLSASIHP